MSTRPHPALALRYLNYHFPAGLGGKLVGPFVSRLTVSNYLLGVSGNSPKYPNPQKKSPKPPNLRYIWGFGGVFCEIISGGTHLLLCTSSTTYILVPSKNNRSFDVGDNDILMMWGHDSRDRRHAIRPT